MRGNHRDGWVFGAQDPLSGQSALLDEAKSLGALYKSGWRPARTIVYASWDGEEPGLLGSTEWAETHEKELREQRGDLRQLRHQRPRLPARPRPAMPCAPCSTARRRT